MFGRHLRLVKFDVLPNRANSATSRGTERLPQSEMQAIIQPRRVCVEAQGAQSWKADWTKHAVSALALLQACANSSGGQHFATSARTWELRHAAEK